MMSVDDLTRLVLIGVGATVVMDVWTLLQKNAWASLRSTSPWSAAGLAILAEESSPIPASEKHNPSLGSAHWAG